MNYESMPLSEKMKRSSLLNRVAEIAMEEKQEAEQLTTISGFCSHLFEIRDMAHFYHLTACKDFSEHLITEILYKELTKLTDSLVESSQNEEKLYLCINKVCVEGDIIEELTEETEEIEKNRFIFPKTYQQSIIDIIVQLLNTTIYKLKLNRGAFAQ